MKKVFYGVTSKSALFEAVSAVCDVMSNGTAKQLLMETAAAETLCGEYPDPTIYGAGTGVMQVDKGTFEWLKEKYSTRPVAKKLLDNMNIDVAKVQYCELENSPVLSAVWARFRYMATPEAIPETLEERAKFWKKHYNTSQGKGTEAHYIDKSDVCDVNYFFK